MMVMYWTTTYTTMNLPDGNGGNVERRCRYDGGDALDSSIGGNDLDGSGRRERRTCGERTACMKTVMWIA